VAIGFPDKKGVLAGTCLDLNLLESAPINPFLTFAGVDLNPSIYEKAASMFLHTAGGHIFDDGNKRTGVLALDQLLLFNGYFLFLPEPKMTKLVDRTADRRNLGISDEQMLREIRSAIESNSAPFSQFRKADPSFYRRLLKVRKRIAEHRFNQPESRPIQAIRVHGH
jgi:prophage maintenance system killer protein